MRYAPMSAESDDFAPPAPLFSRTKLQISSGLRSRRLGSSAMFQWVEGTPDWIRACSISFGTW